MSEKKIEVCRLKAGDLKFGFGNPRKISKKKVEELEQSIDTLGDFGIFLVDENNNVIAGNQRAKILKTRDPDIEICAKRLIGYSEAELRAINIKDNTHSGEWDLDLLADWTADLNIDIGENLKKELEDRKIPEMELSHYEKYDYVLIACRNEIDYNNLVRKLGIEGRQINIAKKRKIKGRAIWYDDYKGRILSEEEANELYKE